MIDLADFAKAVQGYAPEWDKAGIRWRLTFRTDIAKPAALVDVELDDAIGQFIVWTSGEAELEVGSAGKGMADPVSYRLNNAGEVPACLAELTRRLTQT